VWGLTIVALLGSTSACGDSGSDGVGPSAVATGGEDGRIKLAATVLERSGTCPTIRFRLGSLAAGLMVKARGPLATSSGAGIIPLRATRVERR
jgi:hypothetical protein